VSWYNKEMSSWYLAKMRHQVDVYLISIWNLCIFLPLFWCLEVEKLMSKRHQIDDYNISIWKVLSGRDVNLFVNWCLDNVGPMSNSDWRSRFCSPVCYLKSSNDLLLGEENRPSPVTTRSAAVEGILLHSCHKEPQFW
jgi:hypothetical protein